MNLVYASLIFLAATLATSGTYYWYSRKHYEALQNDPARTIKLFLWVIGLLVVENIVFVRVCSQWT